jgi:hypothetical protein
VDGNLLGAAPGSDMLCARQRRAPAVGGQADEILGHQRYGSAGAFLPGGVGRGVDDNLTDDSPPRVVRVASGNEKPRECFSDPHRSRLGAVAV